jgi:hypothetical protein
MSLFFNALNTVSTVVIPIISVALIALLIKKVNLHSLATRQLAVQMQELDFAIHPKHAAQGADHLLSKMQNEIYMVKKLIQNVFFEEGVHTEMLQNPHILAVKMIDQGLPVSEIIEHCRLSRAELDILTAVGHRNLGLSLPGPTLGFRTHGRLRLFA